MTDLGLDTGKLPPQNIDAENAILGAMMVDSDCADKAMAILTTPECFYKHENRIIFEAIQSLYNSHKDIDIVTVASVLRSLGKIDDVGGPVTLARLTGEIGTGAHIEEHSKMVYEAYVRRELITIGYELSAKAFETFSEVDALADGVQTRIMNLFRFDTATVYKIGDLVEKVFDVMQRNVENNGKLIGIGTGLSMYDAHSGGLSPSDLMIIAGETSSGKTSLALTIAKNAAQDFGAKVAFYSLEMSNIQLTARLMAQESGVSSNTMLRKRMSRDVTMYVANSTWKLSEANIYFDDSCGTNIDGILRSIRSMVVKYGVNVVVLDYLQLASVTIKGASKEQQTAYIARALKNVAKELDICVIALSQLSRNENPIPSLNRLRDSGQVEEAADVVMFVYRPERYKKDYEEPFANYTPYNTALINVAKGRNIGTMQFIVSFDSTRLLFKDYDGGEYVPQEPEYNSPF